MITAVTAKAVLSALHTLFISFSQNSIIEAELGLVGLEVYVIYGRMDF